MYKVIVDFADLQDGKHRYHGGDVFPRDGYTPGEDRVAELLGHNNLMHRPLIAVVEEKVEPSVKKTARKRTKKATALK